MPAHQLPEGYSYPLSLQQVLDLGVAQVIAQGFEKSEGIHGFGCYYHGHDGRACHIGACLPLDVAKDWDKRGLVSGNWQDDLPQFFKARGHVLAEFQRIHDNILEPKQPGDYARAIERFCEVHGLTFPQALAPYLTPAPSLT